MDPLTLYFDRNFGKRIPNALAKLNPPMGIRWHQGEGSRGNMPDDEWLEIVGGKNWIVITQDRKFHRIENEKLALVQHGVKCFYFPNANDGLWLTLCTFIKFHHKILKSAQESAAPCLFDVKGTGRIVNIPFLDHP